MFGRHAAHAEPLLDDVQWQFLMDPSVPSRSCCCPARPMVKVIMPPAPGRPDPVDLWLCGHHYRASRAALLAAGADVEDLTTPRHADDELFAEVA
ncbi:hypothetical protein [Trebonia sp.]|uniref:DUF7455 domain-containing protein n=1 Tax=Trebonia sp. TaxID=2767075 RepID=UPI0026055FA6|nr:hypothetical protein [Trebonia sp.]